MAKYTIELNAILPHVNIFGFQYDIYDEKKRFEFEEAFKRHFYFREICCPEPERFVWFLRDKMTTVFPYYNELMRTATIDYDIENPYNLTETYTRKTDSKGKSAGFAYSVENASGSNASETQGNSSRNSERTDNETETANANNEGVERTNNSAERMETVDSTGGRNVTDDGKIVRKELDTPQGKLNLDSTDYLTKLNQDEEDKETREETTNTQNTRATETGETERTTEGSSDSSRTRTGGASETSEGSENVKVNATTEQKTTNDANTRTESMGNQVEEYTMTRKGNIGVNPASYEIDSHIKTQKTLKRIYEMFFEECEDLFMMVF